MANAQPIVNYLKTDRRAQSDRQLKKNTTTVIFVDAQYNSDIPKYGEIPNNKIDNIAYYKPVANHISTIYIKVIDNNDQPESLVYYEAKTINGITKYRNFLNLSFFEEIDVTGFLIVHYITNAYYDKDVNRVIIVNPQPIILYQNTFNYHIKDVGIDRGAYTLDYKDHEGYNNGFLDNAIKGITDSTFKNYIDHQKRKIQVGLSNKSGKVYLYPFINLEKYTLTYVYVVEDHVVIYDIKNDNSAIFLEFNSLHAILAFLNQTIFFKPNMVIKGYKGVKQNFFDDFKWQIAGIIRSAKWRINDLLTILYYTPNVYIKEIHHVDLWEMVGTMLQSNLTNIGLNKEDIVLKLLEIINQQYKNKTYFLIELLNKNTDGNSYFYQLYNKINGENFVKYAKFLFAVWKESLFANSENKIFTKYDGPLNLPYDSNKFLGFYYNNTNIEFVSKNNALKVVLKTGKYIVEKNDDDEEEISSEIINYTYHPFQPIYLSNIIKESSIELPKVVPAFFLKANEDKAFWANVITAIEYTVDIATTFSGFGNIARFRHLSELAKVANRLNRATKVIRYAKVTSILNLAIGAVEISSGTVNALIRLSGTKNKFALALQEYLFYLELLSLSGEATLAIKNGLRKSAKKALKQEKDILKLKQKAETIDDLLDVNDSVKFLEKIAEVSKKIKNSKNVKLYRVQGGNEIPRISRFRFIYKNKKLIINGNDRLYVTFKDKNRVIEFWINRGKNAEVFTANVNKNFFDKIFKDAVPQIRGKEFPNKPQFGDFTRTDFSIGIPKNYFEELLKNMSDIDIIKLEEL